MACTKRENTGSCSHHQCQFKEFTADGYQCVSVVDGYCELGEDCVKLCPHSFSTKDEKEKAYKAFREYAGL